MSRESIGFTSRNVEFSATMRWSCWAPTPNHAPGKSKGGRSISRSPQDLAVEAPRPLEIRDREAHVVDAE
jgi:hypothetical protein